MCYCKILVLIGAHVDQVVRLVRVHVAAVSLLSPEARRAEPKPTPLHGHIVFDGIRHSELSVVRRRGRCHTHVRRALACRRQSSLPTTRQTASCPFMSIHADSSGESKGGTSNSRFSMEEQHRPAPGQVSSTTLCRNESLGHFQRETSALACNAAPAAALP